MFTVALILFVHKCTWLGFLDNLVGVSALICCCSSPTDLVSLLLLKPPFVTPAFLLGPVLLFETHIVPEVL